jgi:hypothetical protein
MKRIILGLLIIVASCNYQAKTIKKIKIIGGGGYTTPTDPKVTLNSVLDDFYADYVKVYEDIEKNTYDTRVRYQKLYDDFKAGDKDLMYQLSNISNRLETKIWTKDSTKNEKLAFYLNAYNFRAIEIVFRNFKKNGSTIKSINDLSKPFKNPDYSTTVAGKTLSLDGIESGTIRPLVNFKDARIHFAVICASKGCPILYHKAYRGDSVDEELTFITKAGLKLKRILDNRGTTTYITKVFKWYKGDFINESGSFYDFIKKYLPRAKLQDNQGYVTYDWSLNEVDDEK